VISSRPPRRSLTGWALLAVLVIIGSYLFTMILAMACVYFPFLIVKEMSNISTILWFLGGVAMALSMLGSLAPRRGKFVPPGPRLDPEQEPRLFAELESIAKAFDEPMPGAVYVVPDVNAFVTERGGTLGLGRRRVMGLGLPLMRILTISQFRAVVAHEFGHYYGGDTRMGPWVYRVRQSMLRTLVSFSAGSISMKIVRFSALSVLARNLVVAALVWYWKLFMRATLAVSRRLEFRADELACWLAGSQALMDGLCSIARGAAAGQSFWQTQLAPALQAGYRPPVAEGFGLYMASRGVAQATSVFLDTELGRKAANPYNTHPPLSARLEAARSSPYRALPADDACAISLIGHLDTLELQLLQARLPELKSAALKAISWD
jgi:heat shock protein HtpX